MTGKHIIRHVTSLVVIAALAPHWAASTALGQARTPSPVPPVAPTPPTTPPPSTPRLPVATTERPAALENVNAVKGTQIVARVGDRDVTAAELRAAIQLLDSRQQAALANDPVLLSQTVRSILATQLVLKEALAKKWDQQPAFLAQLARVRDNLIAESFMQSVATPPEDYPGEAEVKAVYDANATALVLPRRFRLAQVVVPVAKDADKGAQDSAQRKLDDLVRKLKQPGADFSALAKVGGEEAVSAEREGEIGWISEPDLRGELRGAVAGLQKAGISDPIRLEDGWHIVKLLDTEAARPRTLDEVRSALVQKLRVERTEANRRAYLQDLLKQSPPALNELALSQLLSKADAAVAK